MDAQSTAIGFDSNGQDSAMQSSGRPIAQRQDTLAEAVKRVLDWHRQRNGQRQPTDQQQE